MKLAGIVGILKMRQRHGLSVGQWLALFAIATLVDVLILSLIAFK